MLRLSKMGTNGFGSENLAGLYTTMAITQFTKEVIDENKYLSYITQQQMKVLSMIGKNAENAEMAAQMMNQKHPHHVCMGLFIGCTSQKYACLDYF